MKTQQLVRSILAVVTATQLTFAVAHDGHDDSPRKREPLRGLWLAGDTHVHSDHSADGSAPRQTSGQRLPGNLPVADQIAQAEVTGLDFLPLTDHRTYDQHWDPQYRSNKLMLLPGEEANGAPHAVVLGAADQIVDGANPPGSAAFRHVQQSIWDAQSQAAVWSVAHPDNGETGAGGVPNDNASAVGMSVVELYNPASSPDAQIDYAENRWNRGFRFGAAAASDNHFRELWDIAGPGRPTTWVFASERSPQAVLEALRAGRTTISRSPTGPFVTIEADVDGNSRFDVMGGDEAAARTGQKMRLRVRIKNGANTNLYVFGSPGRSAGALAVFKPTAADQTYFVSVNIPQGSSWYRAEVRSPGDLPGRDSDPTLPDQLRAATSPIFVSTGRMAEPQAEIPIPAKLAHSDRASFAVGSRGSFTGFPDAAVSGDTTHIVAEKHIGDRVTVVYRRVDDRNDDNRYERRADHDHRFDGDDVVNLTPDSRSARFPRVAASGNDVWVVWQDAGEDPAQNGSAIYMRHSKDGGRHWQRDIRLSSESGNASRPAIALLDSEHPIVAWSDRDDGPFDVRAQIVGIDREPVNISALGKATDAGSVLDARSPRYPASLFPSIAVTPKGDIAIAWQDNRFDPDPLWTGHTPPTGEAPSGNTDPDNWEILTAVRARHAKQWQAPVRVSANDNAADRHPSLVVDAEGRLTVAWDTRELRSSGVNLSIRASQSADGVTWAAPVSIGLEPTAMSQRPQLDIDRRGTLRAVWYDSRSSDWRWQVFSSTQTQPGVWSAATPLTAAGNSTFPAISKGVVVFTSDRRSERVQRDLTHDVFMVRAAGER